MKRSAQVAAPLLAAAALAVTAGCRKPEMQRCVDQNNAVVDDDLCQADPAITTSSTYRFYYGGSGDYEVSSLISGGSFSPLPGHSYSTQRGGFGSTFPVGEVVVVAGIVGVMIAFGAGE